MTQENKNYPFGAQKTEMFEASEKHKTIISALKTKKYDYTGVYTHISNVANIKKKFEIFDHTDNNLYAVLRTVKEGNYVTKIVLLEFKYSIDKLDIVFL